MLIQGLLSTEEQRASRDLFISTVTGVTPPRTTAANRITTDRHQNASGQSCPCQIGWLPLNIDSTTAIVPRELRCSRGLEPYLLEVALLDSW